LWGVWQIQRWSILLAATELELALKRSHVQEFGAYPEFATWSYILKQPNSLRSNLILLFLVHQRLQRGSSIRGFLIMGWTSPVITGPQCYAVGVCHACFPAPYEKGLG
jgi:hypothetical protein